MKFNKLKVGTATILLIFLSVSIIIGAEIDYQGYSLPANSLTYDEIYDILVSNPKYDVYAHAPPFSYPEEGIVGIPLKIEGYILVSIAIGDPEHGYKPGGYNGRLAEGEIFVDIIKDELVIERKAIRTDSNGHFAIHFTPKEPGYHKFDFSVYPGDEMQDFRDVVIYVSKATSPTPTPQPTQTPIERSIPTPTPPPKPTGFEVMFAIVGLMVVYLIWRRR